MGGGTEDGRCVDASPVDVGRMSPLAALSLLVNEDMAQPAQDESCAGLLILGAAALAPGAKEGGGSTESGIDCVYLRIRAR